MIKWLKKQDLKYELSRTINGNKIIFIDINSQPLTINKKIYRYFKNKGKISYSANYTWIKILLPI